METLGPMSVSAQEFLAQIGRRLTDATTDPRETTFLFQRLSVPSNDSTRLAWQTRSQFPSLHCDHSRHEFS